MSRLYIWGAGGYGKVVLECAVAAYPEIAFLDDAPAARGSEFCGRPVFEARAHLPEVVRSGIGFVMAIGDNRIREALFEMALEQGIRALTVIHPNAIVASSAAIGEGTVVMPGAIINPDARIGRNCIVNSGAIIEHDCSIGDHAHISPRCALGGQVTVGPFAHIGIGAIVLPCSVIGEGAIVGAGAVVLKTAAPGATVVGIPARTLSRSK